MIASLRLFWARGLIQDIVEDTFKENLWSTKGTKVLSDQTYLRKYFFIKEWGQWERWQIIDSVLLWLSRAIVWVQSFSGTSGALKGGFCKNIAYHQACLEVPRRRDHTNLFLRLKLIFWQNEQLIHRSCILIHSLLVFNTLRCAPPLTIELKCTFTVV